MPLSVTRPSASRCVSRTTSLKCTTPPSAFSLKNDVFELFFRSQSSGRVNRQLKLNRRAAGNGWLPESPSRYLAVLFADGIDHIVCREIASREPIRVKPNSHAVVARSQE